MKIIFRHLLREFVLNLCYCLTAFLIIFVMYDLLDNIGDLSAADPAWRHVALYYLSFMAVSLEILAPASLLLATLYTLWQLARSNEIIALRTSGISLFRMMTPFLLVGLAFTLVTTGIKEFVTPRAGFWAMNFDRNGFQEVDEVIYNHHAYYSTEGRRLWIIDRIDLTTPQVLHGVKVTQEREDHTRRQDLYAQRAEYLDGAWWFFGVQEQTFNEKDQPSSALHPPKPDPIRIREMPHFTETPDEFVLNIKPWEFFSTFEMVRYLRANPNISSRAAAQKRFDIHSRIASPWACLVMIIFGIPSGIRGGRQNALVGIFMAIALFFTYYASTHVSVFLGKREILDPWLSAWLPNLLFLSAGLIMSWRMR